MRSENTRAYVTFLILNDSFLPGALLQAYSLKWQDACADRVCLVTAEISAPTRDILSLLFDFVVPVEPLFASHAPTDRRQDLPWLLTRMNALRLGPDGDLGFGYEKIVLLDADILPLKHYQHLFPIEAPAGIINERKEHFVDCDDSGRRRVPSNVDVRGRWKWHEVYREIGHGMPIPASLTDRVKTDSDNMGVNTALMVLEPNIEDYAGILEDVCDASIARLLGEIFRWPDMQYLTMKWSGRWHSIDACFCGIQGYPTLKSLFGAHFAGIKPWDLRHWDSVRHYSRFEDFRYWQEEYLRMTIEVPALLECEKLSRLKSMIEELEARVLL